MVMHNLVEPPKDEDSIGLEDELAPTEIRRRIRGKVTFNHLALTCLKRFQRRMRRKMKKRRKLRSERLER